MSAKAGTRSEGSYDRVVYALRCEFDDPPHEIEDKYLARSRSPEDGERFTSIPREIVKPTSTHNSVTQWVVTDSTGDVSYPLWMELASWANQVVYVGQTQDLVSRVQKHCRDQNNTRFTCAMDDVVELVYAEPIQLEVDTGFVMEQLDACQWVESKSELRDESQVQSEFDQIRSDVLEYDRLNADSVKRLRDKIRVNRDEYGRWGVSPLTNYATRVQQKALQREYEVARELQWITGDDETRDVTPRNLRTYSYWA